VFLRVVFSGGEVPSSDNNFESSSGIGNESETEQDANRRQIRTSNDDRLEVETDENRRFTV